MRLFETTSSLALRLASYDQLGADLQKPVAQWHTLRQAARLEMGQRPLAPTTESAARTPNRQTIQYEQAADVIRVVSTTLLRRASPYAPLLQQTARAPA